MNESDYSPDEKLYKARGGPFSLNDLLRSFADSELTAAGMPRVSDLHMKVGEAVRYRYDGELETIDGGETLTPDIIRRLVFPMLRESQRERLSEDPAFDLDTGFRWEAEAMNFRINAFHDRDGLACVLRMLPKSIPEIDQIGFMNDKVWQDLVSLRQGIVLVTGVTGSGKSTTIASLIDYINKSRKVRVITLEDPIEYVFSSEQALVSQRELGDHIPSFAAGLRSALRENPDIIYLGEIRDPETAGLALTAAETGHLVLSTLHTRDGKGTFSRIIDMFPGERSGEIAAQLSFSIAHVLSQKLVPRKDGRGRIPAFEVMKNNHAIANLARTGRLHQIYGKIETGINEGMNTLEQHLIHLAEHDSISTETAVAHANDPAIIQRLKNKS